MTEATNNLMLDMLRAIRDDIAEMKARLSNIEQGQAGLHQGLAHYATVTAQMQVSLDRQGARFDRIEQRLSLID